MASDSKIFREKSDEPLRSRERATNDNAIQSRSRKVPFSRRAKPNLLSSIPPILALRKTGIRVIGDVPWGAHLCVFFDTKADLLRTAAAYFAAGLAGSEFCGGRSRPGHERGRKEIVTPRNSGF